MLNILLIDNFTFSAQVIPSESPAAMYPILLLGLIWLTGNAQAHPTSYSPRSSSNVVSIAKTNFLGTVRSATTHVTRDLGFQGQIGQYVLLTYGDTMYSDGNYSDHWRGMTSDSVALATKNPLVVIDPNLDDDGYPKQFCPVVKHFGEDPAECALGITNVVETEPGQGRTHPLTSDTH